ncbi:MAG: hypothetical protein LH474_07775 [Chamaesiphon sp.]|nr:hypothetical protein [Chamaesiphon sp.]
MCDRPNFPDLPAWQKLRAELEPYQSRNQVHIIGYIDRIMYSYDDSIARQTAFDGLIEWLDVSDLLDKISLALTPNPSSTSSPAQQARAILWQWLPDRIVVFSIQQVKNNKVIREDGSVTYKEAGVNVKERLKNWLFFPALGEWQKLQSRLKPYKNNAIDKRDKILIELIDKAEQDYLPTQKFLLYIEAICTWMLGQDRVESILTGKTTGNKNIENILAAEVGKLWVEARLESWMRRNLAKKLNPTQDSATKALIALIAKNLHERISHDLMADIRAKRCGNELSLDKPISSIDGDFTLLDTIDSQPTDLDQDVADLQEVEKASRDFPIFQEFLKGLVSSPAAAYQNRWEVRLANYVNQDSKFKLRSTYHVDAACNYQYLLQSLILPKFQGLPPKTITDICREFPAIGEHSLRSHLKRTFDPWVDSIYLEILTAEEWTNYRDYLENVAVEDLTAKYRKDFPACNIFFLAQHRLPCFTSKPLDWVELAELISTTDVKKIKSEYVEKFWQEDCRPALGRIARIEILEYKPV